MEKWCLDATSVLVSRAPSFLVQLFGFFLALLQGDALTLANNVDRVLNLSFKDGKLLWPKD